MRSGNAPATAAARLDKLPLTPDVQATMAVARAAASAVSERTRVTPRASLCSIPRESGKWKVKSQSSTTTASLKTELPIKPEPQNAREVTPTNQRNRSERQFGLTANDWKRNPEDRPRRHLRGQESHSPGEITAVRRRRRLKKNSTYQSSQSAALSSVQDASGAAKPLRQEGVERDFTGL